MACSAKKNDCRALRVFTLAKPLMAGLTYPYDWGFIPSTQAEDGDPLDVLVIHEKQSRMAQSDYQDDRVTGSISPPGLPMIIAPTNVPIPRARSSVVRSKGPCEDASLSCSWTKFSAGIKMFFEFNAEVNRP